MKILTLLLFFSLSFILLTSCTILILSFPRLARATTVLGTSAKNSSSKKTLEAVFVHKPTPTLVPHPTIQSVPSSTPVPTSAHIPTQTKSVPTGTPTPTPTTSVQVKASIPTLVPPTPTQVARSAPAASGFIAEINAYRAQNGLGPVSSNSETCSFASVRAAEIASDFSHNGFSNRINSKSLPYSSYHEVTENIAMNADASQIVTMWINSPGHAENMRKDTPFVCVAQSGNYFAYEGMRP